MSISTEIWLECDSSSCVRRLSATELGTNDPAKMRQQAKERYGWETAGDNDYCGVCKDFEPSPKETL